MSVKDVINKLRSTVSTSKRELLDTAADMLEELTANKQLTMDELKNMVGEPVWIVNLEPEDRYIRIDRIDNIAISFSNFGDSESYAFKTVSYGKRVWAFRRKPEEV